MRPAFCFNQPNVKVSWLVTGVRHDKYAEAHRVEVEVLKEPENHDRYMHAKEWNQPETNIDHKAHSLRKGGPFLNNNWQG